MDAYERAYEMAASEAFDAAKGPAYAYAYPTIYNGLVEVSSPRSDTPLGREALRTIRDIAHRLALDDAQREGNRAAEEAGRQAGSDALNDTSDAAVDLLAMGIVTYCPENT